MSSPVAVAITVGVLIFIFILSIAATSIGLECYNKNDSYANASSLRKTNKQFLVAGVVSSVVGLVLAIGGGVAYAAVNYNKTKSDTP
jgi:hypothetical protein